MPPLVSVCIPTFNGARYVAAAIGSVIRQSFTDFELLVSDDGSSDDTLEAIRSFSDSRLRLVANERRMGLVGNWNRCLALARGKYVTLFHQDDVMAQGNLAAKIAVFDNYPDVGLVYSDIRQINESGLVIGGHYAPQPASDLTMPGWMLYEMTAAHGNTIACPTVMMRGECYQRLGGFEPDLPFATDLEMWLRIASCYDVAYISTPLVLIRIHSEQETARFSGTGRDYADCLRVYKRTFERKLPVSYAQYAFRAYRTLATQAIRMARWKLRQGQVGNGLRYLAVAVASYSHTLFRVSPSRKILALSKNLNSLVHPR